MRASIRRRVRDIDQAFRAAIVGAAAKGLDNQKFDIKSPTLVYYRGCYVADIKVTFTDGEGKEHVFTDIRDLNYKENK